MTSYKMNGFKIIEHRTIDLLINKVEVSTSNNFLYTTYLGNRNHDK